MTIWKAAAAAIVLGGAASPAWAATTLTNGTGDGTVTVTVADAGAFGSTAGAGASNAVFNPIGLTDAANTTYQSYTYLGFVGGPRTNISTLAATVTASSATSVSSAFSTPGLRFALVQTLGDLTAANGDRTGSLLTQTYTVFNAGTAPVSFDLVRYLDGDLRFNGTGFNDDGGGRLVNNGQEILFETDTAIGSADTDTFVGISNDGGTSSGFQVNAYDDLRTSIGAGAALDGSVLNDGADADQFIDAGRGYDVTLGLGRAFTLGVGGSATFTTRTIFGTGVPAQVVLPPMDGVPEPATWGLMLAGFGLVGWAARRRRTAVAFG